MFDENKTYTALYWDAAAKSFYVKRFSFAISDNNPTSFISDTKGSYLVGLSEDLHPRFIITFGGKYSYKEAEIINAEDFIAKKGLAAKGKKCHQQELEKVEFTEPLHLPEDDIQQEEKTDKEKDIPEDEPNLFDL